MPLRNANKSIILIRDGKRITVSPDDVFDFTAEEIEQITEADPQALSASTTIDLTAEDGEAVVQPVAKANGGKGGKAAAKAAAKESGEL